MESDPTRQCAIQQTAHAIENKIGDAMFHEEGCLPFIPLE